MKKETIRKYRPPNSTDGMLFMEKFCDNCRRDLSSNCPILARTIIYEIDDPDYPEQWRYDENGNPVCTAFIDKHGPRRSPAKKTGKDPKQLELF